ncbi:11649_t:CDS:2 [Scutellospora calospora]|uniref:11649_t:CDS:1 n=1 Tax=Scutellospora calospora TaxID=85575 RepID=A0ACA9L761_9GLOM|nr:11649_t:CDS:2 [Scutellospora calospora]
MLEENEPELIGFFDKLVEALILITRSFYNQEEAKKSIVSFCYLFACLKNKFANSYKLDIELHLASAETSYKDIDILANTELIVLSKTIFYLFLELSKFDNIDNLTIHLYNDTILEHKDERSMQNLKLVDFKELELYSFDNYAKVLKIIINIPLLNNYLNQNIISIITNWPRQLFIRKIITYLKIQ